MSVRRRVVRWFTLVAAFGVAVPILAFTAPSVGAAPPGGLPPGSQPTEVNVHPTLDRSLYGAQLAVNPKDPDNIVLAAISDSGYTQACIAAGDPSCEVVQTPFGPTPRGLFETPGFGERPVVVTFDRGQTWAKVDLSQLHPPGRPELHSQNEGELSVGPDGTFYLEWNALDWGTPENFAPSAGVAVSKSTDGGRTWSEPVLTGTPGDFPALTVDQSTGRVYALTGNAGTPLCSRRSCLDPNASPGSFNDAFLVASQDGLHWSQAQRAGGTDGVNQFDGGTGKGLAAANGAVATTFTSTNGAACAFFVGGAAPCTVFQTSTDDGATWSRHRVPSTGVNTLVAADPSTPGHYAVAFLNTSRTQFLVFQTSDSGNTWGAPTTIGNDGKTHWNPWMNYSPKGVLGLVWRTNETDPFPALTPYSIWAATSDDGGSTFSQPLEVNCCSAAAKASPFTGGNIPQDRSAIALSDKGQGVYVGWGDWRTGERNLFFSAVKMQAFKHG